ncbi:MAG TPA: MarR family transcriptional regulator [Tepidisphaeraceae bacterium]|nr:MarR family transcriptional regulator [Tepidisphaeraceae bacterium]
MTIVPDRKTVGALTAEESPTAGAFRGLVRVLGLLRRVMEPYFARHGISGAQWGILRVLQRAEDDEGAAELRLVDLSSRLLVRPPSVTSAIGRLAKMGLVTLVQSRKDQRVKLVSLSAAGRKLVRHVLTGHAEQMAKVLGGLSQPEQATLSELMSRMSSHLETLADAEPQVTAPSDEE